MPCRCGHPIRMEINGRHSIGGEEVAMDSGI